MLYSNVFLVSSDEILGDLEEDGEHILSYAEERLQEIASEGGLGGAEDIQGTVAVFLDGRRYERPEEDASGHRKLELLAKGRVHDAKRFLKARGIAVSRFASCCDLDDIDDLEKLHAALVDAQTNATRLSPNFHPAGLDVRRNGDAYSQADKIRMLGRRIAALYDSDNPPFVSHEEFRNNPNLPCDLRELGDDGSLAIVYLDYSI